jgi:predicted nucleic acid-binding Zn ribbon protein
MPQDDPAQTRLNQLRKWRNPAEHDFSLGQLSKQFKREVEKPFKQLKAVVELWQEMVPEQLAKHTRLESMQRGLLKVTVSGSTRLYELDRLLRQGLERQMIIARKDSGLRKIKLRQGNIKDEGA